MGRTPYLWRAPLPQMKPVPRYLRRVRAGSVVRGGLHELDEHPAGVLGVDEVDLASRGASAGGVVEQPQSALAEHGAGLLDVLHAVRDLLDARATAVEELRDRRLRGDRGEELHARARVAYRHHRLADPLLLVDLLVDEPHTEHPLVEGLRLVEVRDGDADMVDRREQ